MAGLGCNALNGVHYLKVGNPVWTGDGFDLFYEESHPADFLTCAGDPFDNRLKWFSLRVVPPVSGPGGHGWGLGLSINRDTIIHAGWAVASVTLPIPGGRIANGAVDLFGLQVGQAQPGGWYVHSFEDSYPWCCINDRENQLQAVKVTFGDDF